MRIITIFSYVVLMMMMMQIMKIHGFQLQQSCAETNKITQWNICRQCQSVPINTSHKV